MIDSSSSLATRHLEIISSLTDGACLDNLYFPFFFSGVYYFIMRKPGPLGKVVSKHLMEGNYPRTYLSCLSFDPILVVGKDFWQFSRFHK